MSTEEIVLTAERGDAVSLPARGRQPIFWIALACAALVHASFIIGIAVSHPRHIGSAEGSDQAIDVEIVDAKELSSSGDSASSSPPPAVPVQPAEQQQQPQPPEPPQPETAQERPTPPQEQPPEEKAEPEQKTPEEQTAALPPTLQPPEEAPVIPEPAEKPAPAKAAPAKPTPKKKQVAKPPAKPKPDLTKKHQLDLSVPLDLARREAMDEDFGGAVRPPGITRSGENDRFGRDVIRALKRTMPPSYGLRSRVTIRIVLNERGNVAKVQLLQSGGSRDLDDNIMFAARQTAYPFPPKNATLADRTFVVTYVYK